MAEGRSQRLYFFIKRHREIQWLKIDRLLLQTSSPLRGNFTTLFLSPVRERIEVRGRSLFEKTEGRSKE
jgi:hypothetical protein